MNRRGIAQVYPSAAARDQALWHMCAGEPGGLLHPPPVFTSEELLTTLVDRLDLPGGVALTPLAGALLVDSILQTSPDITNSYAGLALGWRLPSRLWRLIVEVKAAGLDPDALAGLPGSGIQALARLMERYNRRLRDQGLLDQADRLARLERMLARGERPRAMAGWNELQVREVLWLRTLDLRLLRAISREVPVSISLFMVPPAESMLSPLAGLLEKTCSALESDPLERLEVAWLDMAQEGGPLTDLAMGFMSPGKRLVCPEDQLSLDRYPGRYGEVEAMARRALAALDRGVEPHDIALVFPDVELYGQMAADVAGRLGLPLALGGGAPLGRSALVRDFLALLRLPLVDFAREELARVLESPYLAGPLGRLAGAEVPVGVARRLAQAGYVDHREQPADRRLERAARSRRSRAGEFDALRRLVQALRRRLTRLGLDGRPRTPAGMAGSIRQMLKELDMSLDLVGRPAGPGFEPVVATDIKALGQLSDAIDQFNQAAIQAGHDQSAPPGRLLAMLEDHLGDKALSIPRAQPHGVRVLRLDQALGLRPRVLLVGGLNQGEFPRRPAGQNLLSARERLALGRASPLGLPVWRLESEEYAGQVLRLLWLLGWCQGRSYLSTCGADSAGREVQPSNFLISLAHRLGIHIRQHQGAVYGDVPTLERCQDPESLRTRLSRELLRPAAQEAALAQAVLHHWTQGETEARRWQEVAARALVERRRNRLNQLDDDQRRDEAGSFDGRLGSSEGQGRMGQVLRRRHVRWSPTSLELYAQCPMSWFFKYLLRLAEVDTPGWGPPPQDEGRWVHECLRLFFSPEHYDPGWSPQQRRQRLQECLDQALGIVTSQAAAGHPGIWQARRGELLKTLEVVIDREIEQMGDMRPVGVEQELGSGLTLDTPDGTRLTITGRLDRLDQGAGTLQVTDYKHTRDNSRLTAAVKDELIARESFQVPVYLAGAAQLLGGDGSSPRARLVSTLKPGLKVQHYQPAQGSLLLASEPEERRQARDSGEACLFNAIEDMWLRMNQGDFVAAPSAKACKWCQAARLCRSRAATLGEAS